MKSAIKVSGVCLSVLSGFAAAVLFIGASALPAQATIPSNASAMATSTWTMLDPSWRLGNLEHSDSGDYTAATIDPPGIYSNVNFNGLI